jgi:DNA transformation protein
MSVSASYRTFILEQLQRVLPAIRSRGMFGGVGIYSADLFFALLADDTLFFKVDDVTRPSFERCAMGPFRPFGEGGEVMQYYQVPEEVLEDPDTLRAWGEEAVLVARRARTGGRRRREPR